MVSIPQAVSTVATKGKSAKFKGFNGRFNTASGKHCCNAITFEEHCNLADLVVSIPQAVSTVATLS